MSKLRVTGEAALKKFNEKIQSLLSLKADKTELHSHSNQTVLNEITQETLDKIATSGSSVEIAVGTGIEIQKPCSKGLVGCVDYTEKKYGKLQGGSYFFLPNLPLLYLDQDLDANGENGLLYTQKIISIQDTGLCNEESPIELEKGKVIYLKGKLGSSKRLFTIEVSDFIVQTEPAVSDGFEYILLGQAVSSTQLILFSSHPIFKYSDGCFCEIGLKTLKAIKGQNLTSIEPASFVQNTDEYTAYYPYCYDLYDIGISDDSWIEVNYAPATLALGCMSPQARSMSGFIRLYANELPEQIITLDNIIFKEVE